MDDARRGKLRELIFGLEDGLVSTMGVVTGVAIGTGSRLIVILSGLVVIFVESLSMAAGSYLSNKSEAEYEAKVLEEERDEIRNHPEKERRELYEYYAARGFTKEEQDIIVARFMSDEELLLEEMAHKELGIHPGQTPPPLRNAFIMLFAYAGGGLVPLLPYLLSADPTGIVPVSVAATALALFAIGFAKGDLVGVSRRRSGLEMMLVGMGAAVVGYAVGAGVGHLLGLDGAVF